MVVALGREVHVAAVVPAPLAAVEGGGALGTGGGFGGVDDHPRHRSVVGDGGRFEHAGAQVGIAGRREAVEAAVGAVLGQVHLLAHRVDGGRLVGEGPHGRAHLALARLEGVALEDVALFAPELGDGLFARQPRPPWRGPARTVRLGAGEDAVGVDDGAVGPEPERTHAALAEGQLAVRDVDPPTVGRGVGGATVGGPVPEVGGARHRLPAHGHDPAGEPGGQGDAVGVGGEQRPVGAGTGHRRGRVGGAPERGPEGQPGRSHQAGLEEAAAVHGV